MTETVMVTFLLYMCVYVHTHPQEMPEEQDSTGDLRTLPNAGKQSKHKIKTKKGTKE